MIKAVIFDIDGVLLDSFEANLRYFQDLMVHFGHPPPTRESYRPLFHVTMRAAIEALTHADEVTVMKIWEVGKQRSVVPYHYELLAMPEGVEETIAVLSEQYLLGIATSRVRESVYSLPQLKRLEHFFRALAAYQDTEHHKPNPDPLLYAAKKLGVQPVEAVYIGDVANDIVAARAAGMKIIIYGKEPIAGADACTADFRTLPEVITRL